MKVIIFLLTIILYNFQNVVSDNNDKSKIDNWFKMKIYSEINKECASRTNNSINSKIFTEYHTILEQYWEPLYYRDVEKFDYVLKYVYNSKVIEKLKELINLIQKCLDNEKQLNPNELIIVIERILKIHAKRVLQIDPEMVAQFGACRFIANSKIFRNCKKDYKNILINPTRNDVTLFQLLTGSSVSSSSCKEILPLEQCFMKAFAPCNSSARKIFKLNLTPPDNKEIICEEFLQETESNDNDDEHINDVISHAFGFFRKKSPIVAVDNKYK